MELPIQLATDLWRDIPIQPNIGNFGIIEDARVFQVLSSTEMLVRPVTFFGGVSGGFNSIAQRSPAPSPHIGRVYLVRGLSTHGFSDNSPLGKQFFRITDTYTYQTAEGASNTAPVAEPFSMDLYLSGLDEDSFLALLRSSGHDVEDIVTLCVDAKTNNPEILVGTVAPIIEQWFSQVCSGTRPASTESP